MATCTTIEKFGLTWLNISGRIDGMSAPDVQQQIDELILGGKRNLVVNLEQVNFVSSAGLRVFFGAHLQLKQVGGEVILYRISPNILTVFRISGFDKLFRIMSTEEEISAASPLAIEGELSASTEDGVAFKLREMSDAETGLLRMIGSQEKLAHADYSAKDVVTIAQSELPFGTGLATVGEHYEEYQHLFGEALIINRNFYFYPAVKRPAVDFMLYSGEDAGTLCRFLHGFSFNGRYRYVGAFETAQDFMTLEKLGQWVISLPSSTALLGLVLIAESKGLFGMNLRQAPIEPNKPVQGHDIFNAALFSTWMNFPVDPADENHIVVGAGVICRDKNACSAEMQKIFSRDSSMHLHAGIFEKGPISKNIDQFSSELERVLTQLSITKVQHLLGQSRFSNGMFGIIELKG